MDIKVKRVYERPSNADGYRILVDRLWPRGLSRGIAKIDYWAKNVAPSPELRKWFSHEPGKWDEFRHRYFEELDQNQGALDQLSMKMIRGKVTFLFGSKEAKLNNAHALRDYLKADKSSK